MRFLTLYRPLGEAEETGPPDPEHMAEMGRLVEEAMAAGSLIATEPLAARALCATVTRSGDGEESVEPVSGRMAGYAFLNAGSLEDAVEFTKGFLKVTGGGTCELRQVLEFGPPA
jgi:hypothetical protein